MSNSVQLAGPQQHLLEDEAHLLNSRGVIRLLGANAVDAVQPSITNSLDNIEKKSVLAYMLTASGKVFSDLFIISHEAGLLIECTRSLLPNILERLSARCEKHNVTATDESHAWRVFGELPNQSTFDDGTPYKKYIDPRWHMGARILRPRTDFESSKWGHENRWLAHALKLGVLPSAELLQSVPVGPLEANLHAIGVLHPECVDDALQATLNSPTDQITQRVLPMRIEPNAFSFPTMTGFSVTTGDTEVGTVLTHQGVYALVLTNLAKWRSALQAGQTLRCAEQPVLITWPTWIASQSQGRVGPAGAAMH
ncbi:MAG: hypothetical protein ACR2P1_25000 [Pseudomonadales bacterium]